MSSELVERNWYTSLIDDCEGIITESVFNSRWTLITGYHNLGRRILEEKSNFHKNKVYGKAITKRVSLSLGKSKRTVELAVQFAKKFPKLDELPEGKNISWHKIVHNYLPAPNPGKKKTKTIICPNCKFEIEIL